MNNEVIKLENVSKHYCEGDITIKAVHEISLKINKGEFTAIVGPSGSGKSTLLNLIGGLDTPTNGDIFLASTSLNQMAASKLSDFRRDHIGFIFQSYNLIPVLSAAENIEYIMLLQKISASVRKKRVLEILDKVGLKGMENRRPSKLSGGQQQRVAVARALVSNPDIILADEPTANLDSHSGKTLLDMMSELNKRDGVTFVFSTHDPKIMSQAKRLIELKDGMIVKDEFN